jgi:hypothetical protein
LPPAASLRRGVLAGTLVTTFSAPPKTAPQVAAVAFVRTDMTNYMEDYFAYGIFPGLGYLALLAAAVLIYLERDFGLDALAGALLLLAIRFRHQKT